MRTMPTKQIHDEIPSISEEQVRQLQARLAGDPNEPLLPMGAITQCPHCGGKMLTTNSVKKVIPTPRRVVVLTRLPGAQCLSCAAVQYDPAALAIIEETRTDEVLADYETTVTQASGKTLGTYFKADLARVLSLEGREHLLWKVLDRNTALVEINRMGSGKSQRMLSRVLETANDDKATVHVASAEKPRSKAKARKS